MRDDGLSYMAYTEQITFLLFLKMADELTKPPYKRKPIVPAKLGWQSLLKLDGECHHTVPVSEYGSGARTQLRDLALVCANCHRMLHRRRPWLTIDELLRLREAAPSRGHR